MSNTFRIVRFEKKHALKARELALLSFLNECGHVPELPKDTVVPDPVRYDNGLGVTAFLGDEMVGFLCCLKPFDNFFGASKGTYVPVNAHGAVFRDRKRIYSLLYEAAADIWVKAGILSHAIGVYSHDEAAIDSLFHNGFGMRTIDAIRFRELDDSEFIKINPLRNALIRHLNSSPMFMPHRQVADKDFIKEVSGSPRRYFVAEDGSDVIAHLKITDDGESFIGDQAGMANIQGAYMKEEYRGSGIYAGLLDYMIRCLKEEGYSLLGVDCESFNPTARGFWLKYFAPYIYGITRRIDERISALYE